MKKFLALLSLLVLFSQPVFAQCYSPCNPCNQCCAKIVPIVKSSCVQQGCAVVPCNPCDPCSTGAACPVTIRTESIVADPEYDYYCCCKKRRGFWKNFFSF